MTLESNTETARKKRCSIKKRKINDISSDDPTMSSEESDDESDEMRKIKTENSINIPKKGVHWNDDECLFLIYGVMKFGKSWGKIIRCFKTRFHEERKKTYLKSKYNHLLRENNKLEKYNYYIINHSRFIDEAIENNSYIGTLFQTLIKLDITGNL